ncbi:hypothetical protein [Campylobacter troglodytis]|uniref:hypothetical protein n=1 Tax=Campylobacter troglodytis TaxID=654363 RepID=UPI00115A0918|nr:hypothetical protein [Campylobacter troglodytis]TQR57690.1 hypothetical protein DMC01_08355 [Campylobacter troglodytis]
MKKAFFLVFVSLVFAILFFSLSRQEGKKRELIKDLSPLACDLSIQACEYEFNKQRVRVEFKNKPLLELVENELVIENLGEFNELNARIYGLNMYMGDLVPSFEKINENSYKADLLLGACVLDTMRFRVEFFEGKRPLDFYFDFDMRK